MLGPQVGSRCRKEQRPERERKNIAARADAEPLYTEAKGRIWNMGPSGSPNTMAEGGAGAYASKGHSRSQLRHTANKTTLTLNNSKRLGHIPPKVMPDQEAITDYLTAQQYHEAVTDYLPAC